MTKIIPLFFLALLTGCTTQRLPSSATPFNNESDDATISLAESARSVSQSLNELQAIEKASHPPIDKPLPYPTASGLQDINISVDWSGPIEPLLEHIAKLIHYKLELIGHHPAIPVLVTITSQNTSLPYILSNINLQAGSKASLFVYPALHTIELRYAQN